MPARALVFALLLSCSSLAATALSLTEEPLRDLPIRVIPPLTISSVHWKRTENTTLQLCALEDIPAGQATLVWGDTVQGGSQDINEQVDDGEAKCSTFQMSSSFRLSANPTFYQLIIKDVSGGGGVLAAGSIQFAMTAQTYILVCGELRVTKLSWATESPITYNDGCIKPGGTPFDTDCYIGQSFSNTDLCFDVTSPLVRVCLNEPINDGPSNDQLSVNYLAYGPPAVLSLNYEGQEMGNMRAIVRLAADPPGQPGQATVYDCPGGSCTMIAESVPVYETYEVCGEARDLDDGHSVETATAKIIDLNLFVFVGGTNVLEFVFANGLENGMYTASLFDTAPPDGAPVDTISVDCTEVEAGHACFGFFSTPTTGTFHVALKDKEDDSNEIIATYTEQIPEQAQVNWHGPQFNHSVRTMLPF